jgi:hypothetical protein
MLPKRWPKVGLTVNGWLPCQSKDDFELAVNLFLQMEGVELGLGGFQSLGLFLGQGAAGDQPLGGGLRRVIAFVIPAHVAGEFPVGGFIIRQPQRQGGGQSFATRLLRRQPDGLQRGRSKTNTSRLEARLIYAVFG